MVCLIDSDSIGGVAALAAIPFQLWFRKAHTPQSAFSPPLPTPRFFSSNPRCASRKGGHKI
jgi:hypothetical protein